MNVVFSSYVWLSAKNSYEKRARKTLMKLTPAASENIVRFKSRQKRSKNNHLACTKAACKKIIKLTPNEENVKSYVLDLATSHISTKE